MVALALSNPERLKWCHANRMDGVTGEGSRPASFWAELLVQNLCLMLITAQHSLVGGA